MDLWIFFVLAIAGVAGTVEVHFENKDGGFFLKHTPRQYYSAVADLAAGQDVKEQTPRTILGSSSSILSIDRFTVFQTSQPISVRATYGPFSTKQTVPARYIVPDPLDSLPLPDTTRNVSSSSSSSSVLLDMDLAASSSHNLDMSAHLVRNEIPRDSPVLRVLFHTGSDPGGRRQLNHHQRVCIILHAAMGDRTPLTAACSPDGEDGVCLAQITIPSSWWAPLPPPDNSGKTPKPVKTPQRFVQVAYSVLEPRFSSKDDDKCVPRVQIQPVTPLAAVPLIPARETYREIKADDTLTMLLPHAPLYPLSRLHVPVFLHNKHNAPVTAFILRARVKSGLRIIGVESSSSSWNVSSEINPKQTVASVTCFRKESGEGEDSKKMTNSAEEIFSWLLEVVENGEDLWDGGRIVWSARYVFEGSNIPKGRQHHHRGSHRPFRDEIVEDSKRKLTARLEIQKDDIQSVLPISKNWELINTAVLTGRQVSQAMKVLIVSQAGKVADVTLQSSCHSEDESVLKVSSSCSSVYVDGSEIRGSSNASVLVKYGTYTGLAKFTVWMPEFPLEVNVPDFRLSQIKGWKVPDDNMLSGKSRRKRSVERKSKSKRKKRSDGKNQYQSWTNAGGMVTEDINNGVDTDKHGNCRLRFQQSPIEVYARFLAEDHDSGRVNYFVNRRTWLRVTDLVLSLLRVSDPRIASLHGRIIQGRSMGRTEVQVLSPITGRVIGAKEVRIGNDKVSLVRLIVNVVSGLQLSISPDSTVENGYVAETSVTRKLTAQYQEGLLDIDLEFSDDSRTPLRDIAVSDYYLIVDSLDPDIVAFAPMVASHHPRVIAVGEGRGDLLRVALLPNEECRRYLKPGTPGKAQTGPLAQTTATVEVDFGAGDISQRSEFVQNDGNFGTSIRDRRIKADLGDILQIQGAGMPPLKDENNHEPTVQARQHYSGMSPHSNGRHRTSARMTPLEIGMYVLLAAFCFAIVVFVVSCVVYASKFKQAQVVENPEVTNSEEGLVVGPALTRSNNGNVNVGVTGTGKNPPEPTTNVHDWVWLGRATLERAASHTSGRSPPVNINNNNINNNNNNNNNNNESDMRITENPFTSDELGNCFENTKPSNGVVVDTSTYCKGRRYSNERENFEEMWQIEPTSPPPPPPPPHAPGAISADEYKPPVPPHRSSITVPTSRAEPQPPKRHHHHHHHRSKNGARNRSSRHETVENEKFEENSVPENEQGDCAEIRTPKKHHKNRQDNLESKNYKNRHENVPDLPDPAFVEFPTIEKSSSNRNSSSEVKRATIVGNPMFSSEENDSKIQDDIVGLEDLNLGMDYDQIMQYFDNLKESNA